MNIYFDTEFIEDGHTIDLISIGLVREDGATYYAISTEFDASKASQWVKDNVLKYLPQHWYDAIADIRTAESHLMNDTVNPDSFAWKSRKKIADEIKEFVGDNPIFYAYYADYDWVTLCQLYGTMMDLPSGWPMYCRDLKQRADEHGVDVSALPQQDEHHALADALWCKRAHEYIGLVLFGIDHSVIITNP